MRGYVMKENKKVERINHCIFFDAESYIMKSEEGNEIHKFRLGVAVYCRFDSKEFFKDWLFFSNVYQFHSFLMSKLKNKTALYCFAHNLAYDFAVLGLHDFIVKSGGKISFISLDEKQIVISCKFSTGKIVFIDSLNIFPMSLSKLGDLVGLKKLSIDFYNVTDDSELFRYCKRDVEILALAVKSFYDYVYSNKLGSFAFTLASQAFKVFRHSFYRKIYIHRVKEVYDLEKRSYFGGRNECFYIGSLEGEFYKLDVNSMYPYVMKKYDYPIKLVEFRKDGCSIVGLKTILNKYLAIAEVELETDEPVYPIRLRDKVVFPVGKFTTCLCSESLRYALENQHIRKVNKVAIYKGDKIFVDYVDYFYNERLRFKNEGNEIYAYIAKLFLNSLYGKFGQKRRKVIVLNDDECNFYQGVDFMVLKDGKRALIRRMFGKAYVIVETDEPSYYSFLAIAAHVTDYARMHLFRLIKRANGYPRVWSNGKNVFYVDTDSLIVNKHGYENLKALIDSNELGKLKLEGHANMIKIYGCKDYVFGDEVKIKGISKKSKKISDTIYVMSVFPSMKKILREGMNYFIEVKYMEKKLKRVYDKGIITENGYVEPIYLNST